MAVAAGASTGTIRVVMLSKAMIVGAYRRKAELIAESGDLALTVAVPTRWREGGLVRRPEEAYTKGYRYVATPIVRSGDFHLHFYPRFGAVLDESHPDVVHVDEEPYNLATFVAMSQARRRGARTLFFTWQNLDRRYPPPFSSFERSAYRHATGAIAGSHTAAEVLRTKGYAGPMWVLPQVGVDEDAFSPAGATPPRPFTVGFAGRLVPAKGVDLLLEALPGLPAETVISILGSGPERAGLAEVAERLGVADRVRWLGWLPSLEMAAHYRSLDVLVLPSRSTASWIEQFGRVLVEAMACGVPCVGSTSGEIPHVLGDAGLVFPEGDVVALRDCLARLAADADLRRRLAHAGRERVLERFTMRRIATVTADIYRHVAAGRPDGVSRADSGEVGTGVIMPL